MQILIIVNDGPYSTERPYQALRLATALAGDGETTVRLFFMSDGVRCAVGGQAPPDGAKDVEWMLRRFLAGRREAAVCQSCMDERGITEAQLIEGASRGNLEQLAAWTRESDRVLVF